MDSQFKPLDDDFEHKDAVLSFGNSMFKISEFMNAMKSAFQHNGMEGLSALLKSRGGIPCHARSLYSAYFNQVVDCELLKPGGGWKKGKIRINISLEFYSDEPDIEAIEISEEATKNESPLDDIRKRMNETQ